MSVSITSWCSVETDGRMEMVFGMQVSFELSVPCFKEIQVSLKMRVFPVDLCPKKLSCPRRLYILCWRELSRRRLLPAVSPAAGHLTTPTVAGLPGLCENFRPTTSKSSPIQRPLSSHWAISVVRARVVGGGQRRRQLTPAMLPPAWNI